MSYSIYCVDIGSVPRGRFGWARAIEGQGHLALGTSPDELVQAISQDLRNDIPVTLGLECPLFVPIRESANDLTRARNGEGQRPWSAGAGAGVLATGLTETVWILQQVRAKTPSETKAFLDWPTFDRTQKGLFVWEAFVSGQAKAGGHAEDAAVAVRAFMKYLPQLLEANAIHEQVVYSLIGAALLRTGWSQDLSLLGQPALVIKP